MPKFYCEYCSIYLTHSSPAGRKQHSQGRKHINAKVDYYQKLVRERFFQPPPFANPQMPLFPGFPMMGLMPGFPGFQPGMVPSMDGNPPFIPPQGLPPMAGPVPPMPMPGSLPGPMPGPLPIPLPGSIPGVPVIPSEMPNGTPELNTTNPALLHSNKPLPI
ncbi:U1 snRNP-specific protein C [Theileria orientalis strain Shintoku]|uniref:U1 small nuclear ribonucleoprotein C n=1 Tax=Theileria orientalis strain Shintoku TaxID=869250 RepID=J4C7U7_THEOR|nr:U1 snRNP-specific protein C [Theileria orientalis strain Shintoku]PVC52502.1 U1 snRNP-specific protein C [Theileria orientalis]BAM39658.1 U1 snRNP-specific protein C [Theileria orientalis strain Shintoku]|eukprot:XP_009689959.1 U1 snRNP-specific protein C [Theileria orientalis strain Shintoku]